MSATTINTDILIVGAGLAGLTTALKLAEGGREVAVVAKSELGEGSSIWAQGGIAAVLDEDDSFEAHIKDTHVAGADLCDDDAVRFVVETAPEAIHWLIDSGARFTLEEDGKTYHLTREGGHSHRRIIHAADTTGREVTTTLLDLARQHEKITFYQNFISIDLITTRKFFPFEPERCLGVYAQERSSQTIYTFSANKTILATGGASKVYLYTSNPDTSTGDGIAMAWRAGCNIANMEFMQFHPTCLYNPQARNFLISEALRGEGAHLVLPNGKRFMQEMHELGELAPRDIVARSIDYVMKRYGYDYVGLDISHKGAEFIQEHFPTITKTCLKFGVDITKEPAPVVPASHYTCGGVVTDLNALTDIPDLYAVGECTFTGLHGANRLASNSLLECIVFGFAAAKHILKDTNTKQSDGPITPPEWDSSQVVSPDEQVVVAHNWHELRRFMWDYVGIVRTDKRLMRAQRRIELLREEINEYYANFLVHPNLIELRNIVDVADLIVKSALSRKESRGLHYTTDYPQLLDEAKNTIIGPR